MNNPFSIFLNVLQIPKQPCSRAVRRGIVQEGSTLAKDRLEPVQVSMIEAPGTDAFVRAVSKDSTILYTNNGVTFLRREGEKAIPVSHRATHISPDGSSVFSITYDKRISPDLDRPDSVICAHMECLGARKERLLSLSDARIVDLAPNPVNETLLLALEPIPDETSRTASGLYVWGKGEGLRPLQTGPASHFADITLSPDGSMLAFRDPSDEEIKTLVLATGKLSKVSDIKKENRLRAYSASKDISQMRHGRPCFSPDGKRVIYTQNDLRRPQLTQILQADPLGHNRVALTSARQHSPAVGVLTQGTL